VEREEKAAMVAWEGVFEEERKRSGEFRALVLVR
jgi:hypothetical protein